MRRVLLLLLIVFVFIFGCKKTEEMEEVKTFKPPEFKQTAYVQTDSDHIAVVNLEDGALSMIKHGKKANSLIIDRNEGVLFVFTDDGNVLKLKLPEGKTVEEKKLLDKICDAERDEQGNFWLSTGESLIVYNASLDKIVKRTELPDYSCGIAFGKDGNVYITNSKNQGLLILDKDLSKQRVIENIGNSIHLLKISPLDNTVWIAEGNEFKKGKPYGVGFAKVEAAPGGIIVYNSANNLVEDFIIVGGNVVDIEFLPTKDYAFVISSQMPEYDEATLSVVDIRTRRVVKNYALCKVCHFNRDVDIEKAFVRSLTIW